MGKRTKIFKGVSVHRKDSEELEELEQDEPKPKKSKTKAFRAREGLFEVAEEADEQEDLEDDAEEKTSKQKKQRDKLEEVTVEQEENDDALEGKTSEKKKKKQKKRDKEVDDENEAVSPDVPDPVGDKSKRNKSKTHANGKTETDNDEGEAEGGQSTTDPSKKEYTVYVSGIPWSCEEKTLVKDFSKCGKILKMNVPMNDQGKPRGIAFISYRTKMAVGEALKFDGIDYGGRKLSVKLADKSKSKEKGKGKGKGKQNGNKDLEVWICGLPFETEKSVLKRDFEECGEIASMNMLVKPDGSCRGVAFITFKTMEAVEKACEYNGTEYGGRWIQVEKSRIAAGDANRKESSTKVSGGMNGKEKEAKVTPEATAKGKAKTFDSDSE